MMTKADPRVVLGPAITAALDKKGYSELTQVQLAVLDPALDGHDLRISSQTGSGKTVAIGFTLRAHLEGETAARSGIARPRALVVTPTRELAKQVEAELAWLFEGLDKRVASVIGGASYRDERRALAAGPAVVVGTPGRLVDHLDRGGIDPELVGVVVLDEADRMLDLGFREELESILGRAPEGHRTHLVSATFPREVRALADRVQTDPIRLEGTRLGEANQDIEHVVHMIEPSERLDAVVNLLAAAPDARTLVFARTRADVSHLASELGEAGFAVASLSGEMEQRERNRALEAFKRGRLRALVATDVAARGIDVRDVSDVIHVEIPNDADAYTHRSGRTGRAGKKGRSAILSTVGELSFVRRILDRARVAHRFEPIPTAEDIATTIDDRIVAALVADEPEEEDAVDERTRALAKRLAESGDTVRVLERLLARSGAGQTVAPRTITPVETPRDEPRADRRARNPRDRRVERGIDARRGPPREGAFPGAPPLGAAFQSSPPPPGPSPRHGSRDDLDAPRGYRLFDVSWGDAHGADARRLLALVCRRGNIRGSDVGAIRVGRTSSQVEVASDVADGFARAAGEPDPRDPRVRIRDARAPREHAPTDTGRAPSFRPPPPSPHRPPSDHRPSGHRPSPRPSPEREPSGEHRTSFRSAERDAPRERPAPVDRPPSSYLPPAEESRPRAPRRDAPPVKRGKPEGARPPRREAPVAAAPPKPRPSRPSSTKPSTKDAPSRDRSPKPAFGKKKGKPTRSR